MPRIELALTGDVMTGRGVDQVLPHPAHPRLYEPHVQDAREYVRLAQHANGPIPRQVDFAYVWGDALPDVQRADLRIINLETAVTSCDHAWPGKPIHYRMHPRNVGCLTAARIDCCCMANNHTLDWGYVGLAETLQTLAQVGIAHPGAGQSAAEAASPAVLDLRDRGRVLVFALGSVTSGIPPEWAATHTRPGVNLLADLSERSAAQIVSQIREAKSPGDVVVVSIHWGGNWGYAIPDEQIRFAHHLVDAGVDILHGHSSHHMKALEVYRDRLIIYGCGDFLDDYEGIGGAQAFRNELRLVYAVCVDAQRGGLEQVRLVPLRARRFRLERAGEDDTRWVCDLLNRLGARFGSGVQAGADGSLMLRWA